MTLTLTIQYSDLEGELTLTPAIRNLKVVSPCTAIYARVEKESTLTMANGNVKVIFTKQNKTIGINLNNINF